MMYLCLEKCQTLKQIVMALYYMYFLKDNHFSNQRKHSFKAECENSLLHILYNYTQHIYTYDILSFELMCWLIKWNPVNRI